MAYPPPQQQPPPLPPPPVSGFRRFFSHDIHVPTEPHTPMPHPKPILVFKSFLWQEAGCTHKRSLRRRVFFNDRWSRHWMVSFQTFSSHLQLPVTSKFMSNQPWSVFFFNPLSKVCIVHNHPSPDIIPLFHLLTTFPSLSTFRPTADVSQEWIF